ncbi:DUF72 domain-containing protein [Agrilactobacillus yilanensis]|uniref:DUF72 domain-containing protein n=1 Tax=Agrilactobacillus yilanensis TaxID=2485997 RepID=A0ABW4J4G5_9LACO|nr:DUF72 domain-containing protein [Agrilactobacillus yilanensis]
MITIGLTTWREHQSLMPEKSALTLGDYAGFFPVVEIDSLFYGLKTPAQVQNWVNQVPSGFQFVVKALGTMTQHDREKEPTMALETVFKQYRQTIAPLVAANKLQTILLQFPPFFKLEPANVRYLNNLRHWLPKLPLAVEFRNPTWYEPRYVAQTISLLKRLQITLVVADEPQTNVNSVPFYPVVTNPKLALLRLHGRNMAGWLNQDAKWRKTRTLYRYNTDELTAIAATVRQLATQAENVCIIFNNNSGGDAADNALALQQILGLTFEGLAPRQMDLW